MLEGEELEKAIKAVMKQIGIVNTKYIKKIAAQIKKIGELNPSSVNRLVAMSEMNNDLGEITEQLRQALGVSSRVIQKIYEKALQEVYTDPRFARYLEEKPDAVRPEARQKLTNYVQALWKQTAGNLYNYSNTTALRQTYIDAIDKAVLATSTGVSSYTETMRSTIRQLGSAGMQVVYASGYHRRLDTAVRQNIVDAVNQINKNASVMLADELNETAGEDVYDAIEISAHARSAPDHEPVQGHVFMKAEWEKLQAGLISRDIDGRVFAGFRRPIGEWNCRHTPMSFSTKWSQRKWTDEQLRQFIDDNQKGCEIDGKHKTLYEAMQMMRDIETQVRREKDTAVAAQAAGDTELRQQCQRNINALVRKYAEIAKASGNAEKRQRMTIEGFRAVKVQENPGKVLTSGSENGKMESELGKFKKNLRSDENITDKYYDIIKKRFVSIPRYAREAYYKFVPDKSVADSSYVGTPHFDSQDTRMIYMDYSKDANNPKGNGGTWFHEHAHMIDDYAGYISHNKTFYDALKSDFADLVRSRANVEGELSYFEACEMVRNKSSLASSIEAELFDYRSQHGVSDMIHGLSGTLIHGCAGHITPGYWNGDTIQEESFAHIFESLSDEIGLSEMKKYFPNALSAFETLLKETIK